MEILISVFGVIALLTVIVMYNTFSWGFVCFKFWNWFVLPVFTTLPVITFWQAIGIMFFITLFKNQSTTVVKKEYKDQNSEIVMYLIAPWLLLLIGYFFK